MFFTSIISFSGPFTSCNNVKNIRLHVTFCKGVRASADISVQSRLCSDCTLNAVLVSLFENLFITTSTCVLYFIRGTEGYALFDHKNVHSVIQKIFVLKTYGGIRRRGTSRRQECINISSYHARVHTMVTCKSEHLLTTNSTNIKARLNTNKLRIILQAFSECP